ncbi:DUF1326 domain-containing protein [Methyloligella solikamskensis]|uniref:DUF1326 domain-containing protein n=1 Tax=Methyloligella solikamskensis TaxID=1177756 RepID=A0ABW3J5Q2_9HYPH
MTHVPGASATIPEWRISGEWFDVCSCNAPCPCTMAQAPTYDQCDFLFAYRINEGFYGSTAMKGLKVVMLANLEGNVWDGGPVKACVFFDASADDAQKEALEAIFTGKAGGWMKQFIPAVREVTGVEFAEIAVEIDSDLERWKVSIPGKVEASGEALTGPTADPSKRVQTFNPPGSEVGPTDGPVTWGKSLVGKWNAFGFDQNIPAGQNSKHIPFEWHGPDAE